MDTSSLQATLVYRGGFNKEKLSKKRKNAVPSYEIFSHRAWFRIFKSNWSYIEERIKDLHHLTYDKLLVDIVNYIISLYRESDEYLEDVIPSAALLTGVNQPDHESQFNEFVNKLREEVSPHIAMAHSQDVVSVKQLVETIVWQLMQGCEIDNSILDDSLNMDCGLTEHKSKLRKSHCTLTLLEKYYRNLYGAKNNLTPRKKKKHSINKKSLIVIIPDFESFNYSILQDLVLILSSHIKTLPIVLVFGVATSVSTIHKSFPFHVSSKLLIRVFQTHSAPVYMNQVLEDIFLTHTCPFQLSGKAFDLLTDVFLFYDFSVTGFIQGVKYCMMEHFCGNDYKSLSCNLGLIDIILNSLTAVDLEEIRRLPSFRPYVEAQNSKTIIALFKDDDFFRSSLLNCVNEYRGYLCSFYTGIRMLVAFIKGLPRNELGKSIKELYSICSTEHITNTKPFEECMQLLNLQSKVTLVESIKNAMQIINETLQIQTKPLSSPNKNASFIIEEKESNWQNYLKEVKVSLLTFSRHLAKASQDSSLEIRDRSAPVALVPINRYKLKEKLPSTTLSNKIKSEFEMVRSRLISYLKDMFSKCLQPPHTQPFHEIFVFDDILSIKKQIIGSSRGAVHMALTNPYAYLQCSCCKNLAGTVAATMPDLCVAYGLLRECGAHVNLHDWLLALAAVYSPEDTETVSTQMQSRFNRVVAELQFLGFIKSSKRKTDHVMRLTW